MITLTRHDIYLMELDRLSNCSLREIAAITTDFHIALETERAAGAEYRAIIAANAREREINAFNVEAQRLGRLGSHPGVGG